MSQRATKSTAGPSDPLVDWNASNSAARATTSVMTLKLVGRADCGTDGRNLEVPGEYPAMNVRVVDGQCTPRLHGQILERIEERALETAATVASR